MKVKAESEGDQAYIRCNIQEATLGILNIGLMFVQLKRFTVWNLCLKGIEFTHFFESPGNSGLAGVKEIIENNRQIYCFYSIWIKEAY